MITTAVALLLVALTATHHQTVSPLKLDHRIPAANRAKYQHIVDAKDWRNPYVIVLKDGVEVRTGRSRTVVAVSDLAGVLVRLPRAAWPYGRVVAVQEIGLRAAADDAAIADNVKAVVTALYTLRIVVSYWPSA